MSDPSPILARAAFLLLDAWRALPMAQKTALRLASPAHGSRRLTYDTNLHTVRALERKALTGEGGDARLLTPEGMHLRKVGLLNDAAAARRNYGRRKDAEALGA